MTDGGASGVLVQIPLSPRYIAGMSTEADDLQLAEELFDAVGLFRRQVRRLAGHPRYPDHLGT
jgi:hypothetical protein